VGKFFEEEIRRVTNSLLRAMEKKVIMPSEKKGYKHLMGKSLVVFLLLLIILGYLIKIYSVGKKPIKVFSRSSKKEKIQELLQSFCSSKFKRLSPIVSISWLNS